MKNTGWHWNWLLYNISNRLSDHYQIYVGNNTSNLVLYRFDIKNGMVLNEVHIILRTNIHTYRVSSMVKGEGYYKSFNTVGDVVNYLEHFLDDEIRKLINLDFEVLSINERAAVVWQLICNDKHLIDNQIFRALDEQTEQSVSFAYHCIKQKILREGLSEKSKRKS